MYKQNHSSLSAVAEGPLYALTTKWKHPFISSGPSFLIIVVVNLG